MYLSSRTKIVPWVPTKFSGEAAASTFRVEKPAFWEKTAYEGEFREGGVKRTNRNKVKVNVKRKI